MIFTAQSAGYAISVKQHGAELASFRLPDGTELLWQADPAFWPRHAPNLFPIVGRLRNDVYSYQGSSYPLKQHGFARDSDFQVAKQTPANLVFRLESSTATRGCYPFDFVFEVEYLLEGPELAVTYHVRNPGNVPLPFSVGAHPAFACNWQAGDAISDYYLEFSQQEKLSTHLLENGLLSDETRPLLDGSLELTLDAHSFDRDAFVLLDHVSRSVTLRRRDHPRRLTVSFPGFPHLGIWSKPGAPFVCIEPWIGHADLSNASGAILAKPGIVLLDPGSIFASTYTIQISP